MANGSSNGDFQGLPEWAKGILKGGAWPVVLLGFIYMLYTFVNEVKPAILAIPRIEATMREHRRAEVYALRTCIAASIVAKIDAKLCEQPDR